MNKLYKSVVVILHAFLLISCGSGSDAEEVTSLIQFIEHDEQTTYVNNSERFDFTSLFLTEVITGAIVYVQSDLDKLIISGSNNILYFSEGVSVSGCEVRGNDNTAVTPDGLTLNCEVTGLGNTGF